MRVPAEIGKVDSLYPSKAFEAPRALLDGHGYSYFTVESSGLAPQRNGLRVFAGFLLEQCGASQSIRDVERGCFSAATAIESQCLVVASRGFVVPFRVAIDVAEMANR